MPLVAPTPVLSQLCGRSGLGGGHPAAARQLALRRRLALLVGVSLIGMSLAACGKADSETAARATQLEARLAEAEQLSSEKDQLLQDFVANTEFMNNINVELDRVRKLPLGTKVIVVQPGESPIAIAAYRDSILARIREMTARVDSTEARLARMQGARPDASGATAQQVASYRRSLDAVREQLAGQSEELVSLQSENTSLRSERDQLRSDRTRVDREKAELNERLADAKEAANTVYFVAGSADALKKAGILREEGGARNVLLMKRGKTLVPMADLPIDAFTALSKTGNLEIQLPKPNQSYRIVSSHSTKYLEPAAIDGKVRGTLRITDPDAFWSASRFLIFVEQ